MTIRKDDINAEFPHTYDTYDWKGSEILKKKHIDNQSAYGNGSMASIIRILTIKRQVITAVVTAAALPGVLGRAVAVPAAGPAATTAVVSAVTG